MHELAVTQGVLAIALDAARQAGAGRVTAIDLLIGELTGFVDDAVQFYFDILSRGTPAEGAALRFRREPATALCADCGHRFAVSPPLPPGCPACAGSRLQVSGGRALRVESIEIEGA